MDLTYLVVAVFGMCALRPCRSLPTAAAATAAAVPTPAPSLQAVAAEPPVNSGKKFRSLFLESPHQYHLQDGIVDPQQYDDAMVDGFPLYQLQRQHEDELRIDDNDVDQEDVQLSSRARPNKPDSPVYFIRLPPQPYMYVPGYGYVSQPTRLEPPPFTQQPHSPFLNLPLGYVSNGKPVGIYTLPQQPYQPQSLPNRPKPHRRPQFPLTTPPPPPPPPPTQHHETDSPVYNLDKGPYVFNGRPDDVYLLQNAYDNLYSEVLQNIYP